MSEGTMVLDASQSTRSPAGVLRAIIHNASTAGQKTQGTKTVYTL